MLKGRTLLLSTVPQKVSTNDTPKSLPNWYGSKLMSFSPDQGRQRFVLQSKQPAQFLSLWGVSLLIQLRPGLLPAWQGPEVTLRG